MKTLLIQGFAGFSLFSKKSFFCSQKGIFYWFLRFFVKKYFFRTIKKS